MRFFRRFYMDLYRHRAIYIMLIPVVAYYLIFCYWPMYGVVIAFKNYKPRIGIIQSPWLGLAHFQSFFSSMYFGRVLRNTLLISGYSLIFGFPIPIAFAILLNEVKSAGYKKILCGGFSAGCDMLLRAIVFTSARCDVLVLQSPWIPILQDSADELMHAIRQKEIALKIFCGAQDEDCLPMARQLYALAGREGVRAALTIQENSRHQFPAEPYTLDSLL